VKTDKTAKTIIATKDKDLKNSAGLHFNWQYPDAGVVWISEEEAIYNFYKQLLTGDDTDNIVGCGLKVGGEYKSGKKKGQWRVRRVGVGPAKAIEVLADCNTEFEMYEAVLAQYVALYPDADNALKIAVPQLKENAILLWMVREYNEDSSYKMWEVPSASN